MKESDLIRLSAYVDDELDAEERRAVEAWLETSAEARTVLAQLQQLDGQLASHAVSNPEGDAATPDEAYWQNFGPRVQERIRQQAASKSDAKPDHVSDPSVPPTARPAWRLWAVAASVVLVVWVGARVWQRTPGVGTVPQPTSDVVQTPPAADEPDGGAPQGGRLEAQRKATAPQRMQARQELDVATLTRLDSLSLQRAAALLGSPSFAAAPDAALGSGAEARTDAVAEAEVAADLDTLLWSRRHLPAVRPLAVTWMQQVQEGAQALPPDTHRRWLTWLRDTAAVSERPSWDARLQALQP